MWPLLLVLCVRIVIVCSLLLVPLAASFFSLFDKNWEHGDNEVATWIKNDVSVDHQPQRIVFQLRRNAESDRNVYTSVREIFMKATNMSKRIRFYKRECSTDTDLLCGFEVRHYAPIPVNRECLVPPPSSSRHTNYDSNEDDHELDGSYVEAVVLHEHELSHKCVNCNVPGTIHEIMEFINVQTESYVAMGQEI
jgi:hypothetical protein